MIENSYQSPVNKLLTYGKADIGAWLDYLSMGITSEDIPELIHMATDRDLIMMDSPEPEIWAPIHAWRALGQLRAENAVEPLIKLLDGNPELSAGIEEWALDELPEVFALIGPMTIPTISIYLSDVTQPIFSRVAAGDALTKIAEKYCRVEKPHPVR